MSKPASGLPEALSALAPEPSASVATGTDAETGAEAVWLENDDDFGATPGARLRAPLGGSAVSARAGAAGAKEATKAAFGLALDFAVAAVRRGANRSAADQPVPPSEHGDQVKYG